MTGRHKPGTFALAKRRSNHDGDAIPVRMPSEGRLRCRCATDRCSSTVILSVVREDSERPGSRRESNRGVGERLAIALSEIYYALGLLNA
jgi:hypothetical protein